MLLEEVHSFLMCFVCVAQKLVIGIAEQLLPELVSVVHQQSVSPSGLAVLSLQLKADWTCR